MDWQTLRGAVPLDPSRLAADDEGEAGAELEVIEMITDAYLGHLGVDDVLRDLTSRLADRLQVDTAVVLLRDGRAPVLTARAAFGIEEEVRQGVRIPLGSGFAGTVATEARPRVLDRVDASTVLNPLLWEKGLATVLGVPLMNGDAVIGVLHVGSLTPRTFTVDDVRTLQHVADRVAAAVTGRSREVEQVSAQVLQRSFLPSELAPCPGVEFGTRFVPAEHGGVGGDWYDAFQLPGGDLHVIVGDVAGHGLAPAIVMGRLRSTLRAYALEGHDPESVLTLADDELKFFEPDTMVTVLIAVLSPPFDRVRLASAGHLPPVLALPDGTSTVVEMPVRAPLGAPAPGPFRSAEVDFPLGATMLACTDGLVERRNRPIDEGLELLRAAVRAAHPEVVCREVMEALVGHGVPGDDIAVVAFRHVAA